jgi:hypothetical protein
MVLSSVPKDVGCFVVIEILGLQLEEYNPFVIPAGPNMSVFFVDGKAVAMISRM